MAACDDVPRLPAKARKNFRVSTNFKGAAFCSEDENHCKEAGLFGAVVVVRELLIDVAAKFIAK